MTESCTFDLMLSPHLSRIRQTLGLLSARPPQVLLMEGGTEAGRLLSARYWGALLHCPSSGTARPSGSGSGPGASAGNSGTFPGSSGAAQPSGSGTGTTAVTGPGASIGNSGTFPGSSGAVCTVAPCGHCSVCQQILNDCYPDLLIYDGRISNKDDEENPGPIRALTIKNVRLLRDQLRDMPHGSGKRVVILLGMDITRNEAANGLLKVLEEPSETTVFVLLAAQREQLLPTLVSRSQVLCLPWPEISAPSPDTFVWERLLASFLHSGQGLFAKTFAAGALTPLLVSHILLACQKALSSSICTDAGTPRSPLTPLFAVCSLSQRSRLISLICDAQESLQITVNPARVLESFALQLFVLIKE